MKRPCLFVLFACAVAGAPPLPGGEPPPDQDEYVYVENTKRLVGLLHEGVVSLGYLDSRGTFTPDRKLPPFKANEGRSGPGFTLLQGDPGTAYEYRSGRLILGEIDRDGNFVPDLGSKVIAFKDYKPGGNAPPIYNLPGWFAKKGERKEKGKP